MLAQFKANLITLIGYQLVTHQWVIGAVMWALYVVCVDGYCLIWLMGFALLYPSYVITGLDLFIQHKSVAHFCFMILAWAGWFRSGFSHDNPG